MSVNAPRLVTALDPNYPSRLRGFADAPSSLTLRGGTLEAEHAIAVVGSRRATDAAVRFVGTLCRALVRAGVVVVSGGAAGIDAAAHRATLDAGGVTWAIAGTGPDQCYPSAHAALFEAIGRGPGVMFWPFGAGKPKRSSFLIRNRILVALADAVVVVQAGLPSGAIHAARWARKLNKALWVVPAAPWSKGFAGSRQLLEEGALPLTSTTRLLAGLNLPAVAKASAPERVSDRYASAALPDNISDNERSVLAVLSNVSLHLDAIAARSHMTAQAAAAALLTLALENVLVEAPPGFFRRRDSCTPVATPSEREAPDGKDARGRGVAREGQDHQEVPGVELRGRRLERPR